MPRYSQGIFTHNLYHDFLRGAGVQQGRPQWSPGHQPAPRRCGTAPVGAPLVGARRPGGCTIPLKNGLVRMARARRDVVSRRHGGDDSDAEMSGPVTSDARSDVYKETGVDTAEADAGLNHIIARVQGTWPQTGPGRVLLPIGYFANVIEMDG